MNDNKKFFSDLTGADYKSQFFNFALPGDDNFNPNFAPLSEQFKTSKPFTAGGLLERDPNKTINSASFNFLKPDPNFQVGQNIRTTTENKNSLGGMTDPQKVEGGKLPKLGPIKELNEAFEEKEDKGFMGKLNSIADKIFTLQDKNPQAYMNIISGLDLYNRGQKGEKLGEALVGNSKFRNEQLKALLSNAYTQSVIDYNNSKTITALTSKAKGADFVTSGRGLIPQLEDRITAEYFAGVDKETIPARQIAALSSLLIPDIEKGIDKGLSMNAAIDIAFKKAEQTGAISKEKIIKDGGFMYFDKTVPAQVDASKFKNDTRSLLELKSRPSNQGKSDEEIKAAVEANGLILVD